MHPSGGMIRAKELYRQDLLAAADHERLLHQARAAKPAAACVLHGRHGLRRSLAFSASTLLKFPRDAVSAAAP